MSPLRAILAACVLACVLAPRPSRAQTCTFSAGPTALAFGAYDPSATAPTDSTGAFTYSCTSSRSRPVIVALSTGNGGSFNPRQMSNGVDQLAYNLYSDTQRTVIWGDGTGGSQTVSTVPQGSAHGATLTIYGRIGPGLWVTPGAYTDTIVVTLNY